MRTFRAASLAALTTLTVLALAACTGGGQQSGRGSNRVMICHATSSESNPFVRNVVDDDASVGGHDGHANDIIPPFDYLDNDGNNQQYEGKNWGSVGQALHDNECNAVDTEAAATSVPAIAPTTPTTTEATSPSTTRDSTPTTAATTAPPTTEGTTSPPITQSPAPTPAPTTEAPTQTTAAPTTTAGGGSGATATTSPPGSPGTTNAVSGNQNQPSDPSATTTPGTGGTGAAGATTTVAGDGLPTTGSDTNGPVLVGGLLLALGVLAALLGRRMAVRPEKD